MGHSNLWLVVPRQVFTPYCCFLISSALVVPQSCPLSLDNQCVARLMFFVCFFVLFLFSGEGIKFHI